jgi:hypothetical protein
VGAEVPKFRQADRGRQYVKGESIDSFEGVHRSMPAVRQVACFVRFAGPDERWVSWNAQQIATRRRSDAND